MFKLTENLGFKNNVTSCRLVKCISSGNLWSSRFSSSVPFLFLPFLAPGPVPGIFIPAPLVTPANSSLPICFRVLFGSGGLRKSILNASFFSRRGFVPVLLAPVVSASAIEYQNAQGLVNLGKQVENKWSLDARLLMTFRNFQCSGPAQFLRKFWSK